MRRAILVIVVIALLFGAYRLFRPAGYKVVTVERGPAVSAVYATGTVEPVIMLPIAPRLMGRLVELNLDEGALVQKDQQLGKLEDNDLKSAWDEAKAKRDNAARELARSKQLLERGALSISELDSIRSDYEAFTAAAKRAEVEAGYMTLRAPEAGRIIRRDGELGELIPANQPVFWIAGSEDLRISAEVDEEDISKVKVGDKVLIRADAFREEIFEGMVSSITDKGNAIARSFRVRISLGKNTPLRIGMTAETNIVVSEKKDALLVPTAAITARNTVWIVMDGRLEERSVRIGVRGVDKSEILSGVSVGEEVVAQPIDELRSGMKIRSIRSS
jgi:RND family efflux transporter MFP subunit